MGRGFTDKKGGREETHNGAATVTRQSVWLYWVLGAVTVYKETMGMATRFRSVEERKREDRIG